MFFSRPAGHKYVDRGDIDAYDFEVGDLTCDWTWRELDFSAIVPANAVAVHLQVIVRDDSAISNLQLRKKGFSNEINIGRVTTQNNLASLYAHIIQPCDADRIIEYRVTNTTWNTIALTVFGWFVK